MNVSDEFMIAEVKAAEEFLKSLHLLIVSENYLPEQIRQEKTGRANQSNWAEQICKSNRL